MLNIKNQYFKSSRSRNLVSIFLREMPGAISDLLMRRMANRTGQDSPGEVHSKLDTPREGMKKEMKERNVSHFILSFVFQFSLGLE